MGEIVIRDARPGDRDAIREVTLAAYLEYADVLPQGGWEEYRQNILETIANPAPAEQIVAERDGHILGTVLLFPAGTVMEAPDHSAMTAKAPEVRLLAVAPAGRRQGVGEALMRECIARARAAGASAIALHTTDLMQVAMQMYERMGFVRTPETDYYPAPDFVVKGYRYALV